MDIIGGEGVRWRVGVNGGDVWIGKKSGERVV